MGYVLKAVLSSAQHPEYGQITVPFPIPDEKYDRMIDCWSHWKSVTRSGRIAGWMNWTASIPY